MYFIVDIEATCWEKPNNPDLNEIIEIAIIVCDSDFQIVSSWNSFVKPIVNQKLSPFCSKLTGIKQYHLENAKNLQQVISEFNNWFCPHFSTNATQIEWYTWGDWDVKALKKDCERQSIIFPFGEHRNLRAIYIQKRNNGLNSKCNLREAVIRENLQLEKWHRAIYDARAAAHIAKSIFRI